MRSSKVKQNGRTKPVAKFKAGPISAALWENEIKTGNGLTATVLKTTIQRRYKDSNGSWKYLQH
jgi:hypothetical protein